jgi:predicted GH43/DUF377 family glycosyl hydrolase
MMVECLLNPGVFRFEGAVWMLVRVAERPKQEEGKISFPVLVDGKMDVLSFDLDDPLLDVSDPREVKYDGEQYLSTLSHLRLFKSADGVHFEDAQLPLHIGIGELENFGVEDCRVATMLDGEFLLTYTAASASGYGVGLKRTRDWRTFEHLGLVLPPANKDCAIFEEKVNGQYVCLNRPSGIIVGGHYIWLSFSNDLQYWGRHSCIAKTRKGMWDSSRVGAGAAPIKTKRGWLVIYHGADENSRYCLGALLLDLEDPTQVIARSEAPLMEPLADYECNGFFGEVVFTNGHIVDGDEVTIYYGASDSVICSATLSIKEVLSTL